MTPPTADCPPDDTLSQYLDDALSPTVVGPLTAHIDGCRSCQAKLDAITTGGAVGDRLKALSSLLDRSPDKTLDRGVITATDTRVFGSNGIPMIPRVQVTRPTVPGYEVEAEIGRGGMGVVFRAMHKRLNRTMALKMVLAAGVADPRVSQRFLFEAELLARVQHPQVVQVYEVNMFTAPTGVVFPYLAMELLPGGTLAQWSNGKRVSPTEAAALVEGLARAVHAVHLQGIVHRDLKPANVLRSADGVFKVSDFGLAKLTAEPGAQLTGSGMVVGTPAYMAPEQAGGGGTIGPPADVYSLGAMLFELLCGRPPFPGDDAMSVLLKVIRDPAPDVRTLRADLPRDLAAVVMKCLAKEPARRYPSADDLADDLDRFLHHRPTRARTLSKVERVWYWARRNPTVATLLGTLAVVLTAGFVSTFILWRRAEATADEKRQESLRAGMLAHIAKDEREKANRSAAFAVFDQAVNRCEAGYVSEGLRLFLDTLTLAERLEDESLVRVIRTNIAAWEAEQPLVTRTFPRHGKPGAVELSPDGEWVLIGDGDGRVRVWDADDDQPTGPVHTLTVPVDPILDRIPRWDPRKFRGVAADRTREWVAACTSYEELVVWSTRHGTARRIQVIPFYTDNSLWQVAFAGGRLWLGGGDGLLFGYDLHLVEEGGDLIPEVVHVETLHLPGRADPGGTAAVAGGWALTRLAPPLGADQRRDQRSSDSRLASIQSLRASNDGSRLFCGDRLGRVIEWDPVIGRAEVQYSFENYPWVFGLAVSQDNAYVAAGSTNGRVRLWNRGNPNPLYTVEVDGSQCKGVALTADGGRMIASSSAGQVITYDTRCRSALGPALRQVEPGLLAVRPATGELLVDTADGVRFMRPPRPKHLPVPFLPPGDTSWPMVRFLDFRPDGNALAVGCGRLLVCDPATGGLIVNPLGDEEPLVGRFSTDGERLVYGARHSWALLSGNGFAEFRKEARPNWYAGAMPSRPDATVTLISKKTAWTYHTDANMQVDHKTTVESLADLTPQQMAVSADGREWRLGRNQQVEFVSTADGTPTRDPIPVSGPVTGLAQTPDGNTLAVLVADETAVMFDVSVDTPRAWPTAPIPVRHRSVVSGLALSRDGGVLATVARDRTLQFWDTKTGLVLGPRRYHNSPVTAVTYSHAEGRNEVAVGTSTGAAMVWQGPPPPTEEPLEELERRLANPR